MSAFPDVGLVSTILQSPCAEQRHQLIIALSVLVGQEPLCVYAKTIKIHNLEVSLWPNLYLFRYH